MVHVDGPVGLDGVAVGFDDERAVADAGIVLAATLAQRLGIEALVDERVDPRRACRARRNEGAKVMTLVSAMALGADCIDDCDVLRAGRTADVLGHRVMAPSTLGTFLRAFTFGHVRQLDRVLGETLQRAWAGGRRPRRRAPGRRRRLLRRRGLRPEEAGRGVRLHPRPRLSPDPRHARRHRRGAAHPPAEGLGEHLARDRALLATS